MLAQEWDGTFKLESTISSPDVFRRDAGGDSRAPILHPARDITEEGPNTHTSPLCDSPDLAGVFRERAGDGPTLHPGNPILSDPSTTENSTVSAASR